MKKLTSTLRTKTGRIDRRPAQARINGKLGGRPRLPACPLCGGKLRVALTPANWRTVHAINPFKPRQEGLVKHGA